MAALDFPNSPTSNQQYAAPNGVTYQWDGAAWIVTGGPPGQLWTQSGGTLTPTTASNVVALATTGNPFTWITGHAAMLGRVGANPGDGRTQIAVNRNLAGTLDDNTKPGWVLQLDPDVNDDVQLQWAPSGGGAVSIPFRVNGADLKTYCTLADGTVTSTMLANGATVRNANVKAPAVSFNHTTLNTWVTFVTCGPVTTSANALVFIFSSLMLGYTGAAGHVWYQLLRDGSTVLTQNMFYLGGNCAVPLGFAWYDNTETAGTHNYVMNLYHDAGTIFNDASAGNNGALAAFVMS